VLVSHNVIYASGAGCQFSNRTQVHTSLLRRIRRTGVVPEGRGQPQSAENLLYLGGGAAAIALAEAVVIPALRERPHLRGGQHLAWLHAPPGAPGSNQLFRPEEEDRPSGEAHILVPAGKGNHKVDHRRGGGKFAILHRQDNGLAAVGAGGLDPGVGV